MKTYTNDYPSQEQLNEFKEHRKRAILKRIICDLVESDSIARVKEIIALNRPYFELWPILYNFAERAMIRIRHLEIQKRIFWKEFIN